MATISGDQVQQCYEAALAVSKGDFGQSEAVQSVIAATGMNAASASDYVSNIRLLLQPTGRIYARTMKISETARILDWIVRDFDAETARVAAQEVLRHVEYYARLQNGGNQPTLRATVEKFLSGLPTSNLAALAAHEAIAIEAALRSPHADRKARLAAADPKPRFAIVSVKIFLRNPDVVAEVLDRADGQCDGCGQPAPFTKLTDGRPYLEVHHRKPLSEGGDDLPDNALALCPNCHREAHHGQKKARFLTLKAK
jgi:5-methylcytosine-specific restriction enzyme A